MGISHSNAMVLPELGGGGLKKLSLRYCFPGWSFTLSFPLLLTGKMDVKIFNLLQSWLVTEQQKSSSMSLHLPKIPKLSHPTKKTISGIYLIAGSSWGGCNGINSGSELEMVLQERG